MSNVLKIVQETKVCTKCKEAKTLSEFYFRKKGTGLSSAYCKECHKEDCRNRKSKIDKGLAHLRYKKWMGKIKSDPKRYESYKESKVSWTKTDKYFDSYFKRKFGISLAIFTRMLAAQNGMCANIGCDREIALSPQGDQAKAVVDHSHTTGKVRSLMCVRCNALLGHIENRKSLVRGLMDYLSKHNSEQTN